MNHIKTLLTYVAILAFAEATTAAEPLKVYILAGQSNMQGHAQTKTLEHLAMSPETVPILDAIRDTDGKDRVFDDIWISSLGSAPEIRSGNLTTGFGAGGRGQVKIGPELTFGITMAKHVGQPILIIKTAWGGKSLHTDFRPPSAGAYEFNEQELKRLADRGKDIDAVRKERVEATGVHYRQMVAHIKDVLADISKVYPDYNAQAGYELSGFVWFQGWNDMVDGNAYPNRNKPGGYDEYASVLTHFIRDVRNDLDAPKLPFVVGVMGTGGPINPDDPKRRRYVVTHGEFRAAMAAPASLPEFQGNVVNVLTENYWDAELSELVDRRGQVQQLDRKLKKDDAVDREARQVAVAKLRAELFTDDELQLLETAVSNAEYHYLGSAKILTQIGSAFANALAEM